jgi:hypothetical protein
MPKKLIYIIKINYFKIYYLLLLISGFYLIYNFNNDSGYWFDEWSTLLSADPNVSLNINLQRLKGFIDNVNHTTVIGEKAPYIYFLTLRLFFGIFGFTAVNGRLFSLLFFILSIFIFYKLLNLFLNKNKSLIGTALLSLNPLMLWMSNETRIDTFNICFVIINIYIFFRTSSNNSIKIHFIYIAACVLMMSIYPLTISVVVAQFFFHLFYRNKKYILNIISFIIYVLLNYNYIFEQVLTANEHYSILYPKFFLSFFFNTFFGNKYFGAIYLILFFYLTILNLKKIINDKVIFFCLSAIFFTYTEVIIATILNVNVAAPRYIDFIVPVIIFYITYSASDLNFKIYKKYFTTIKILVPLFIFINIYTTNDSKPVKKPPTNSALEIIKSNNIKNIYVLPNLYFETYIKTVKNFQYYNFALIDDKKILKKNNLNSFAFLCLNNPRFAFGEEKREDEIGCEKQFNNFQVYQKIYIKDYIIILYKKN